MRDSRFSLPVLALAVLVLLAVAPPPAAADQVFGTGEGCGGFSCFGFDVFRDQSQAVRFTPTSNFRLDQVDLWFMNNDFSGMNFGEVTLTLEGDLNADGCSTPDGVPLETLVFQITAIGWEPVLETVESTLQPPLQEGVEYWIVAKSDSEPFIDPVWVAADGVTGFNTASVFGAPDVWQCGGEGAVPGVFVQGSRVGSDYQLTATHLVAGQDSTLAISGAEPNTVAYVAFSTTGPGETFLAPLNVTLELASPKTGLAPITTDADGNGEWTLPVPPGAAGRTLWIQSVQLDGRSDVVEAVVE